ncbi:TPR-like protein [Dichomitus squalens LYAD-421 SS1]|uniref:TPR-like protein n=1 Tax=Dichomitus squalens (strain LYAD-421) TaxID=732165 RepID=UPI0004410EBC|nr:TPR-like protein [Dichomitus squalens LYAD-421 SS1]EJF66698.1 TPR-like protein [Dichomitus squalens LYAD-421 SS1]
MARDAMMAYAYYLYDSPLAGAPSMGLTTVPIRYVAPQDDTIENIYRGRLLPLLLTLVQYHPNHLPILLLLACTYHVLGDYHHSLSISQQILSHDPEYVEAMSNIGTTMKALGQTEQAYEWWWKALQLRPTYGDALDNILGMTFQLAHGTSDQGRRLAYYRQALGVCQFVQRHVFDADGHLSASLRPDEVPRLQRAIFTSGTIYSTLGPTNTGRAVSELARAIELVIRPPPPLSHFELYTLRDLLLAACVAGHIMSSSANSPGIIELSDIFQADVSTSLGDPTFNLLHVVRTSGDQLLHTLLRVGDGILPTPLLVPEEVVRLQPLLFPWSKGVFPAICTRTADGDLVPPADSTLQQTNGMTSTVLLTLAKRFQENALASTVFPDTGDGLRVSTTVVVLLYYLALSRAPAPSTYNNLGIVISGIAETRRGPGGELLDGTALARIFYSAGLKIEPQHPHLLTNLGSLLKDQGQVEQAIKLYMKAIEQKPDFDIALANLGNAIKDIGRPWDAIEYYRRAAAVNPSLPEAVCGLVNSLSAICDWRGRGAVENEVGVDDSGHVISSEPPLHTGWMARMVSITDEQIKEVYLQGIDGAHIPTVVDDCMRALTIMKDRLLRPGEAALWRARFHLIAGSGAELAEKHVNGSGFLIRFIDWIIPQMQRRWYVKAYGKTIALDQIVPLVEDHFTSVFVRPKFPKTMQVPLVPSVLPFHTFTYPLSPRVSRLIAHRNALRASYVALSQPWMPSHVCRPPRPPVQGKLTIAYISNDVNNHPLSHLMQSVFGMHDKEQFNVLIYSTSPWDGTVYRPRIASMVENCFDVSAWSLKQIFNHIQQQEVHILINLGGYTKGSRNDVCAARPCPIQMQLMGYPGSLGGNWCDYLVCDPIACPQDLSGPERWRSLRTAGDNVTSSSQSTQSIETPLDLGADIDPEDISNEWVYTERLLYMQHTFMVADHKQSYRGDEHISAEDRARMSPETLWLEEERRRADARRHLFPDVPQDVVIFANFNQLYKVDPSIFLVWVRILRKVPRSILWLLRFPSAGEEHLLRSARLWGGDDVASRIHFTDVAKKDWHVYRARAADIFLDTAECNAHTIAADVLWTGTPILTWPKHRHKMCSRVAASMLQATGFADHMIVHSAEEYEARAVALAHSIRYVPYHEPSRAVIPRGQGELMNLRRNIFLNRDNMPLYDTLRWTRNLEKGLREAWRRWVEGTQYETSDEWEACDGPEKRSSCIWVQDDDPVNIVTHSD